MYIPPFEISSAAVNLIADISAQIERYAIRLEQKDGLLLRKVNRIRTIHGSLAIEGNTLSENEVRDIIEGKEIVAPAKEIQEVKNAIRAYNMYESLNPFDFRDLLRAHGEFGRRCRALQKRRSRCGWRKRVGSSCYAGKSCAGIDFWSF